MEGTPEPRSASIYRPLIRVGLLVLSLAALWFAESPIFFGQVRTVGAHTIVAAVFGIVAGFLTGLALFLPERWSGYRWRMALPLVALPLFVLAYTLTVSLTLQRFPSPWLLGHWLRPLLDEAPQLAVAVIVGVALSSGFSARSRT